MNDTMLYFILAVMGYILGKCVQELTQEDRERKRIKRAWEAQHRKEAKND